jgi:hypothetical protein
MDYILNELILKFGFKLSLIQMVRLKVYFLAELRICAFKFSSVSAIYAMLLLFQYLLSCCLIKL